MEVKITLAIRGVDDEGLVNSELEQKIIGALAENLEERFTDETKNRIFDRAKALMDAKTQMLIESCLEAPVTIQEAFRTPRVFESMYDYIEHRLRSLYEQKIQDNKCHKDPVLIAMESHITREVDKLLAARRKEVTDKATAIASKAVENHKLIRELGQIISRGEIRGHDGEERRS